MLEKQWWSLEAKPCNMYVLVHDVFTLDLMVEHWMAVLLLRLFAEGVCLILCSLETKLLEA